MDLKPQQPPMSIDEQIDNLKSIGLIISDEEYAKAFLDDVSYFRIIKAYSLGLKVKNGDYHSGVTFEQIVGLYLFNSNFRQVLFPLIERVEINLRCRLANYISSKYGVLGYEDSNNFNNPNYHAYFLEDVKTEIKRNKKAPFVKNFAETYIDGKIPFYALVELLSFGTLSKFYKNLENVDKKNIAKSFGVGYTYLESWIESIAYVRNICAHYGRLYNAKLSKTPILYKQYADMGIKNNRVFAILICLKHLVSNDRHWIEFIEVIDVLLQKYPSVDLSKIGFPQKWQEILTEIN